MKPAQRDPDELQTESSARKGEAGHRRRRTPDGAIELKSVLVFIVRWNKRSVDASRAAEREQFRDECAAYTASMPIRPYREIMGGLGNAKHPANKKRPPDLF